MKALAETFTKLYFLSLYLYINLGVLLNISQDSMIDLTF